MEKRFVAAVWICLMIGGGIASAQSNRFAGTWDSETGVVWNVDQSVAGVKVTVLVKGKQVRVSEWMFEGPPVKLLVTNLAAQTTARFDGETVTLSGPITLKDASTGQVEETWKLSRDGEQLIVSTTINSAAIKFSRQQSFRRRK